MENVSYGSALGFRENENLAREYQVKVKEFQVKVPMNLRGDVWCIIKCWYKLWVIQYHTWFLHMYSNQMCKVLPWHIHDLCISQFQAWPSPRQNPRDFWGRKIVLKSSPSPPPPPHTHTHNGNSFQKASKNHKTWDKRNYAKQYWNADMFRSIRTVKMYMYKSPKFLGRWL